jgi:hypothetical protein
MPDIAAVAKIDDRTIVLVTLLVVGDRKPLTTYRKPESMKTI